MVLREPSSGSALLRVDVQAPTLAAPADGSAEVWIEGDDNQIVHKRVVDDDGIDLVRKTGVTGAGDPMAPPHQQQRYRLDHVLVDEERV
jgi:hypothetical protein